MRAPTVQLDRLSARSKATVEPHLFGQLEKLALGTVGSRNNPHLITRVGHAAVGGLVDRGSILVKSELVEDSVSGVASCGVGVRCQGDDTGAIRELNFMLLL